MNESDNKAEDTSEFGDVPKDITEEGSDELFIFPDTELSFQFIM